IVWLALIGIGRLRAPVAPPNRYKFVYSGVIWGYITLFCCIFLLLTSYRLSRDFHLFGTGEIGQDIFYYTIKSIRTGLIIGTLTTLFMLPLAIILGISA